MRITSVVAGVVAGLTLALTGCGGAVVPEQAPEADTVVVDEQKAPGDVNQMAICPLKWLCYSNWVYYSTQAACTAVCGGSTCERDYACTGNCVCP
ncbi:hypothetical protein [Hyalangium versicolor]|uniref:hypothetical protein n=1 Tax=Hyalangium versicolor TaxID=2861190 RepID=UPI001CCE84FF|nr:hypothetical protein [Hyalangium versicolor]